MQAKNNILVEMFLLFHIVNTFLSIPKKYLLQKSQCIRSIFYGFKYTARVQLCASMINIIKQLILPWKKYLL